MVRPAAQSEEEEPRKRVAQAKKVRALAFYRKHGWRDLGLRPGRDNVNLMECDAPTDLG